MEPVNEEAIFESMNMNLWKTRSPGAGTGTEAGTCTMAASTGTAATSAETTAASRASAELFLFSWEKRIRRLSTLAGES